MKLSTLAILAASGVIAAATPVMAQPYGGYHDRGDRHDHSDRGDRGRDDGPRAWDLSRRIDWLQRRIDRGREDGSLDRREAYRVQSALDEIRHDMRVPDLVEHGRGHRCIPPGVLTVSGWRPEPYSSSGDITPRGRGAVKRPKEGKEDP